MLKSFESEIKEESLKRATHSIMDLLQDTSRTYILIQNRF